LLQPVQFVSKELGSDGTWHDRQKKWNMA